jgi:hypothetical protein
VKSVAVVGLTLTVAVAVAGCGGSDEDRVRDAVNAYFAAAVSGNGERLCGLISEGTRASAGGAERCTANMTRSLDRLSARERGEGLRVVAVRVRGDTATATLSSGNAPLHLRKERGEWRIDAS